jgi:hypothetical protein
MFNFQSVELPPQLAQLRAPAPASAPASAPRRETANLQFKTRANLASAEGATAPVKLVFYTTMAEMVRRQ